MPLFYLIHNLPWGQHLSDGQRNCRTFLFGVCIYMGIYLIFKNLQLHGYLGGMYDALYSAFIVILCADVAVMGYIYRSYFGRNILHELGHADEKQYYDPITHTYLDHVPLDVQLAKDLEHQKLREEYNLKMEHMREEIERLKEEKLSRQRTEKIIEDKNQLRAVVKIQRWWREHLYEPGRGPLFLKAQHDFKQHTC